MSLPKADLNQVKIVLDELSLGDLNNISKIETGTSTENYILTLSGKKILARFYPDNPTDSGSEFRVLSQLYAHGLSVPKQIKFVPTGEVSRPFVLMEYVEGQMLGELYLRGEVTSSQSTLFIEKLLSIHKINWQALFQTVNLPDYLNNPFAFAERVVNGCIKEAESHNLMEETGSVIVWMKSHAKVPLESPKLLHGDYHPLNIIVRKDGEFVVLDWEGVDIGDIRKDVAFTALTMGILGGKVMEKQFIDNYGQMSGELLEDINFYLVTEAFHRIVKFYRVLQNNQVARDPLYVRLYTYLLSRIQDITGINLGEILPLPTGI